MWSKYRVMVQKGHPRLQQRKHYLQESRLQHLLLQQQHKQHYYYQRNQELTPLVLQWLLQFLLQQCSTVYYYHATREFYHHHQTYYNEQYQQRSIINSSNHHAQTFSQFYWCQQGYAPYTHDIEFRELNLKWLFLAGMKAYVQCGYF